MHKIYNACRAPRIERLEALAVDDLGARLVVLLLGDPHLLEGGQRGQNGAADPHRVLAFWRSYQLETIFWKGGNESTEFIAQSFSKTGEEC